MISVGDSKHKEHGVQYTKPSAAEAVLSHSHASVQTRSVMVQNFQPLGLSKGDLKRQFKKVIGDACLLIKHFVSN